MSSKDPVYQHSHHSVVCSVGILDHVIVRVNSLWPSNTIK